MKKQAFSGILWVYICWFCLNNNHSGKGPLLPSSRVMWFVWDQPHPQHLGVSTWPRSGQWECHFPLATVTGSGWAHDTQVRLMRLNPRTFAEAIKKLSSPFVWGGIWARNCWALSRHHTIREWSWPKRKESHRKELVLWAEATIPGLCNYGSPNSIFGFFFP